MSDNWGCCRACSFWQIEPSDPAASDETLGVCSEEHFVHFRLSVKGSCGCGKFVEGRPARVESSRQQPPHASEIRTRQLVNLAKTHLSHF